MQNNFAMCLPLKDYCLCKKVLRAVRTYTYKFLYFSQLMENKISTIERGAFQDLKELERL